MKSAASFTCRPRPPAPDFYGGNRHGMNLFANSLVALDATTGKRLWHFQIVHHDLLDKDLPCPPVLLTVKHNGQKIDAVAQGTKHGLLFVFDRVTGEPLWPIEERPVPQTDLRGEQTWPTQPFPTKPAPLMRQLYTEADVSDISPRAPRRARPRCAFARIFGPFPAPSLKETDYVSRLRRRHGMGRRRGRSRRRLLRQRQRDAVVLQMVETRRADGEALSCRASAPTCIHAPPATASIAKATPVGGFPRLDCLDWRSARPAQR